MSTEVMPWRAGGGQQGKEGCLCPHDREDSAPTPFSGQNTILAHN